MWTTENRARRDHAHQRYPSDLLDEEWASVAPLIPPPRPGGRRRTVDLREVVNGVLYVLSTGSVWRHVPADLPPMSTVFLYFDRWASNGTLARIHQALHVTRREQRGCEACPTACVTAITSTAKAEPAVPRRAVARAARSRARSGALAPPAPLGKGAT